MIGSDESLTDDLWPQRKSWLLDLKNLADVKIQQRYLLNLNEVQRYELHYCSDASVTGF